MENEMTTRDYSTDHSSNLSRERESTGAGASDPQQPTTVRKYLPAKKATTVTGLTTAQLDAEVKSGTRSALQLYAVEVEDEDTVASPFFAMFQRTRRIFALDVDRDSGIGHTEIGVLLVLNHHLNSNGTTFVDVSQIANALHCSNSTVKRALSQLRTAHDVQGRAILIRVRQSPRHPQSREADVYEFGPAIVDSGYESRLRKEVKLTHQRTYVMSVGQIDPDSVAFVPLPTADRRWLIRRHLEVLLEEHWPIIRPKPWLSNRWRDGATIGQPGKLIQLVSMNSDAMIDDDQKAA
jgi:hypothetical protein